MGDRLLDARHKRGLYGSPVFFAQTWQTWSARQRLAGLALRFAELDAFYSIPGLGSFSRIFWVWPTATRRFFGSCGWLRCQMEKIAWCPSANCRSSLGIGNLDFSCVGDAGGVQRFPHQSNGQIQRPIRPHSRLAVVMTSSRTGRSYQTTSGVHGTHLRAHTSDDFLFADPATRSANCTSRV